MGKYIISSTQILEEKSRLVSVFDCVEPITKSSYQKHFQELFRATNLIFEVALDFQFKFVLFTFQPRRPGASYPTPNISISSLFQYRQTLID